ncbi:MAG: D-ribose pyranase [Candidatus Lumbricidophila eiseniae]|uniref:D-ribose pyranase n=1 Tax=Candidatus Lumbricidiphila eiseniae TaxID=1969409 RepID=A0A2A6FPQ1_9MICO|nr:MAG: D-ribose pyranase [Candidatus Lumbricidophila eiseniae]
MLKTTPILNSAMIEVLARVGHGQVIVVSDAGLPRPAEVPVIDLAVVPGLPGFVPVVRAILAATALESYVATVESHQSEPFIQLEPDLQSLRPEHISHAEFKQRLPTAAVIIRTGECTPFVNIALVAGVVF